MLNQLPATLDLCTHVDTSATGEVDKTIVMRGRFGTLDSRPAFVPKPGRILFQRQLSGWEVQRFSQYVASLGAPVVAPPGVQAYRQTDVLAFFNLYGLWDLAVPVPPLLPVLVLSVIDGIELEEVTP